MSLRASGRPPRRCRSCGTDITDGHPNRQRCEPCALERKRQVDRDLKRSRYQGDPDYRARRLAEATALHAAARADPVRSEELRERQRRRYRSDEAYRTERQTASRESHRRAQADPARRAERNARQRERYREDEAYRAKKLASGRATYRKRRA